jgi:small ligand-binding sensory domain FIST
MSNAAASRLVHAPFSEETVRETARELLQELGGEVSCAFVFASADYRPALPDFLELLQLHGHVPLLVGCSGAGLIGTSEEAEQVTGFTALFLRLPKTKLHCFALDSDTVEGLKGPAAWHQATGVAADQVDSWMFFGNPMAIALDRWLAEWNGAYPGVPCIGGLASAAPQPDDIFVFENRRLLDSAVALGFQGGLRLHTLVSQGCRPVGEPFTITGAEENVIVSLGQRPAYERLAETFESLAANEKARAAGNMFAGLAVSEYVDEFKTGDFLVRNLVGADPQSGALAIGALPRVGQTLQFQLRDRRSANDDLQRMLLEKTRSGVRPFASLVFSCNGRGQGLFRVPNHDAAALSEHFGPRPSAGIFCNGEIGPVGGRNFVHGYTASIALLADA